MNKIDRKNLRYKRKRRISSRISGTAKRPRLAVFRSLQKIYVQIIDDLKGKTLTQANSSEIKEKADKASKLGELIAKKCKELKISEVVFDRGGYKYHGKIKELADGARKGGLKF